MKKPEILKEYDGILKEQLRQGILEPIAIADPRLSSNYLLHHAVIKQDKKTSKVRIVYDGSARCDKGDSSINNFLYTGPNLIPKLQYSCEI